MSQVATGQERNGTMGGSLACIRPQFTTEWPLICPSDEEPRACFGDKCQRVHKLCTLCQYLGRLALCATHGRCASVDRYLDGIGCAP